MSELVCLFLNGLLITVDSLLVAWQVSVSVGDEKTLRIWEIAQRRCSKTIDARQHFVTAVLLVSLLKNIDRTLSHLLHTRMDTADDLTPCTNGYIVRKT